MRVPYRKPIEGLEKGTRVQLVRSDSSFDCAYKGKAGVVLGTHGNQVKLLLDCGHFYHISTTEVQLSETEKCAWCWVTGPKEQYHVVPWWRTTQPVCDKCWSEIKQDHRQEAISASIKRSRAKAKET